MKILLTFTGFHDPYSLGLVGEEEQPGPILSLVGAVTFITMGFIWLTTFPNINRWGI